MLAKALNEIKEFLQDPFLSDSERVKRIKTQTDKFDITSWTEIKEYSKPAEIDQQVIKV